MKIAICLSQSSVGGVGTSTYILASGMRRAGHQADILITDWRPGNDFDRARCDGWPVEAICLGERWLRRRLEVTLGRLSQYDVVINNHSTEAILVAPALPHTTIRLSVIRSTDDPVIQQAYCNCQYLDALVGISPQVSDLLMQSKVCCKVRTIPNAVLVENDRLPSLANPLQIVFIGRLENRQKNVLILPEIAEYLRAKGLDFKMTIIGDGPNRLDLESKVSQMNLKDLIDFRGAMKRGAAWDVYRTSHFSLIPSHFEGFGLVVAESMAAGAVPVTSNIPVFGWILGEFSKDLLVPTNNSKAYAERICALVSAPELYLRLQIGLQRRQKEYFSPSSTVNGYLRLIEELKTTCDQNRFSPVPLNRLPLSSYNKRRCSRAWWLLQKLKYWARKPKRT